MHAPTTVTTAEQGGASGFSDLHSDILKSHILSRLDGPSLISVSACSPALRRLSDDETLWSNICHSTWPSTISSRLRRLISDFLGGGPRAFYSHAFPILTGRNLTHSQNQPPPELISAVDVHYKNKLIFSKVLVTKTGNRRFRCSPFRVDLLEPKDTAPTPIKLPERDMIGEMRLSWTLIDPIGKRAVNLSSQLPVEVQRHCLTGKVLARYASILAVDGAHVQCGIVVTCSRAMEINEVSLAMEDLDGMHLNGKESLVFLQAALEGKKGTARNRAEEAQLRYNEYVEMKRERGERKQKKEGVLNMLCMALGVSIFLAFCCFLIM